MNRKSICALILCALMLSMTSCELGKPTTGGDDDGSVSEPSQITAYDPDNSPASGTDDASGINAPDTTVADINTEPETTAPETVAPETTATTTPPPAAAEVNAASYSGTINSATCQGINVRIDWVVDIAEGASSATVSAEAYFDYLNLRVNDTRTGALKIGDASADYSTGAIHESVKERHSLKLAELTTDVPLSQGQVELSAEWNLGGNYGGVYIGNIVASGTVMLTDDYASLPSSYSLDVQNVLQTPELPNGCEITALTTVLNYAGFNVDKLTMNDKYLAIGDTYSTDPSEACAGNPRETASFGCYSPVIANAAEAYLSANSSTSDGVSYRVQDISGVNVDELYRQVAGGTPVIVWVTSDINTVPTIYRSWTASNGKLINWKHPSHTVVLTGYDMTAGTVTVADPMSGTATLDMDTFELRYIQMGAQAVIVNRTDSVL